MLEGLMQNDFPLTLAHVRQRMRTVNAGAEVVTLGNDGKRRASYGEVISRVDRLAAALKGLGIEQGDRVATFAWNSQEHLECYVAIPSIGAVLHTINFRLSREQLRYIINHARDRVIFVDRSVAPLLVGLQPNTAGAAWIKSLATRSAFNRIWIRFC